MKNLLIFFGVLTFVTQAYCNPNHELLTVLNDSSHSICLNFHDEKDNQYSSSIVKPQDRTVLDLSTFGLDSGATKSQLSYITITLEDKAKGNNLGNVLNKRLSIKRKVFSAPIRITNTITEYLKLNN